MCHPWARGNNISRFSASAKVPIFILNTLVLCGLFVLTPFCFANIGAQQILEWIELKPKMDLPPENYKVTHDDLGRLEPWLVPGLFEELSFPKVELIIQRTQKFPSHKSYQIATKKHAGEAFVDSDGSLKNYAAGKPFSDVQIKNSDPIEAGYMVGWNWNHRWQHYGLDTSKMPLIYLGNKQENAPLNKKLGLLGRGSIDRLLVFDYRKVYLNHLSMLPNQGYSIKVKDSENLFFKEFYEFLSPHNVAGTMFLVERKLDQHADDQVNIYSPTERRVRRYSARERADPVMGSNATLDDVESFSGRVLDYKWRFLGERELLTVSNSIHDTPKTFGPYSRVPHDGWQLRTCYVLELESILDDHPYKKRFLFIDKETYSVATSLIFNRENQFWKVLYNVYKWRGTLDGVTQDIRRSVPYPQYSGFIDLLANTATIVHTYSGLDYPVMSPKKVKRKYSVSKLGEGR